MITEATIEQIGAVGEMAAAQFYLATKFLQGFELEAFEATWTQLLSNESGVILILWDGGSIVGALGGVAYPDINSGRMVATEFFWVVTEGLRGGGIRLYRAFEQWARQKRCSEVRMIALADSESERLAKVYGRLGFEPIETHYRKEL